MPHLEQIKCRHLREDTSVLLIIQCRSCWRRTNDIQIMLIRPFHSPSTSTESTSRSDVIAGLLWRCSWIRCSSVCIWRTISTTCCENYKTLTLDTFWLSLVVKHVNMLSSSRSLKCECMRIARANSTDFQESNSLGVSLHNIKEVYQPTGLQPERGNLAIPRPSKFSKTFWKRLKCFSCYAKQQVAIVLLSPEIFSWLRPWQQIGKKKKKKKKTSAHNNLIENTQQTFIQQIYFWVGEPGICVL